MELSLIMLCFLRIFVHNWRPFMSEVLYLHQTFSNYVSDWYLQFNMLIFNLWLQVMENSLIKLLFLKFSFLHVSNVLTPTNFYKLYVKMKSKPLLYFMIKLVWVFRRKIGLPDRVEERSDSSWHKTCKNMYSDCFWLAIINTENSSTDWTMVFFEFFAL